MFKRLIRKIKCHFGNHLVLTIKKINGKVNCHQFGRVWNESCIVTKYKCTCCGEEFCIGETTTGTEFPVSLNYFNMNMV